jgi:hypothetical protein
MAKNERSGRRKPERPVISVRFDPKMYEDLKAEADGTGISVTQVVHRRLTADFMKHRLPELAQRLLAEFKADFDQSKHGRLPADFMKHLTPQLIERVLAGVEADQSKHGAEWQQERRRDVEASLRSLGYTRIVTPGGALWAEPDASIPASIVKVLTEPKA